MVYRRGKKESTRTDFGLQEGSFTNRRKTRTRRWREKQSGNGGESGRNHGIVCSGAPYRRLLTRQARNIWSHEYIESRLVQPALTRML